MNVNFLRSWRNRDERSGSVPDRPLTNKQICLKAVQVDGELLLLRCWSCGTEHCVNIEQCTRDELALIICSKTNCRMSLFLVNELSVDEQTTGRVWASERNALFAALSRLWKMKRDKPNTQFWKVLTTVNVLAVIYPINLLHRAESADATLFAAFLLIGIVFLLLTVDAVSVVTREVIGDTKH